MFWNQTLNGTVVAACTISDITNLSSLVEQCNYVQTNCQNLLLDMLFCHMNYELWTRIFFVALLLVLLFLCFYLASSTAEDYFVPSLIKISQYLYLNENVAGLTLIAFGNSAPDLLTIILSTLKGNEQLGFAEPISAAAFVTTVVFALCVLVASSKQNRISKFFLRDVGFFFLVISFLFIIYLDGKVEYFEAILCLVFYVLYVFIVYITGVIQKILKKRQLKQIEAKLQLNNNSIKDEMLQEMKNIDAIVPPSATTPTDESRTSVTIEGKTTSLPSTTRGSIEDTEANRMDSKDVNSSDVSPHQNLQNEDNENEETEKAIQYLADLHLYQKRLHKKYKKRREIHRKLDKMFENDSTEPSQLEEYNNLSNYRLGSHSTAQLNEASNRNLLASSFIQRSPMATISPISRQTSKKSFILPKKTHVESPNMPSKVSTTQDDSNSISDEVYKARLEAYTKANHGRRSTLIGRLVENVIEKIIDKTGVDRSKVVNALQQEEQIVDSEIKHFNDTVKQEVEMDAFKKEMKKQLNQEIDMVIKQEIENEQQPSSPSHIEENKEIVVSPPEETIVETPVKRRDSIVEPFDGEFLKSQEMNHEDESESNEKVFVFPQRRRHNMIVTPEDLEHTQVTILNHKRNLRKSLQNLQWVYLKMTSYCMMRLL